MNNILLTMLVNKNSFLEIFNTVSWMWRQMAGYRAPVFASVFMGVVRIVASLAFIWISKELIDAAVNSETNLTGFSVGLIVAISVEIICSALQGYLDNKTEVGLRNSLRDSLFRKALNGRCSGKEKWHTGDVVNRLEDCTRIFMT